MLEGAATVFDLHQMPHHVLKSRFKAVETRLQLLRLRAWIRELTDAHVQDNVDDGYEIRRIKGNTLVLREVERLLDTGQAIGAKPLLGVSSQQELMNAFTSASTGNIR